MLTESPQTFKGGQVWGVMTGIHSALQAIGYGLLVLFFAVGVMKTCGSFVEVKKPEHALKPVSYTHLRSDTRTKSRGEKKQKSKPRKPPFVRRTLQRACSSLSAVYRRESR